MDPQKLSAQELVQLCLDSQDKAARAELEAAWVEFMRRFHPLIAGVITKRVLRCGQGNPALIDDLVQETYIKLLVNNCKALRNFNFKHENAFFGFLKVIAMHVTEDYFRSQNPPDTPLDDIDKTMPGSSAREGTQQSIEKTIQIGKIDECLKEEESVAQHFARDYKIFWLYYGEGLTAKEISELPDIGLNIKGVESALLRLTHQIKGKLARGPRKKATGR